MESKESDLVGSSLILVRCSMLSQLTSLISAAAEAATAFSISHYVVPQLARGFRFYSPGRPMPIEICVLSAASIFPAAISQLFQRTAATVGAATNGTFMGATMAYSAFKNKPMHPNYRGRCVAAGIFWGNALTAALVWADARPFFYSLPSILSYFVAADRFRRAGG